MYLYLDNDTWVHRLHPLVRLAGMIAVFIAAFAVERPLWQLPLLAGVVALLIGTGSLPNIWRLRVLFILVFVMTLLIWTVFYGPDGEPPLFAWRRIHVSQTAPWFGLGMALKLESFLGAGILFLSVTRIEEFAYALTRLGVPYKLGFTMTMAFRLVPVFVDSAATVVQAQRCRGLDFEHGNPWQRLRRYVPVMVPVFMGALRRADQMAMALEARGFQSSRPRTTLDRHPLRAADVAAGVVLLGVTALYLWLWYRGVLALR
ncbi:MAG: energy-coupling factor transporter transmembrane component T [Deltaproteobacteria bacterium]|nr:energy-coupling factor transporter transmembrane component T [Deltaproteobacteria bacterium]